MPKNNPTVEKFSISMPAELAQWLREHGESVSALLTEYAAAARAEEDRLAAMDAVTKRMGFKEATGAERERIDAELDGVGPWAPKLPRKTQPRSPAAKKARSA